MRTATAAEKRELEKREKAQYYLYGTYGTTVRYVVLKNRWRNWGGEGGGERGREAKKRSLFPMQH